MASIEVQPARTIRAGGNGRGVRYWIHVFEKPDGSEFYTLRRTHPHAAIFECWGGRELGWRPVTADYIGKRYSRYGDAYRTLRKLQEADRTLLSAAGRKRHLELLAPQLAESLRDVLGMAQGAPFDATVVDRARILLRHVDRGY